MPCPRLWVFVIVSLFGLSPTASLGGCSTAADDDSGSTSDDDTTLDDDTAADDDTTEPGAPPVVTDPAAEVATVGIDGIKPSLAIDAAGLPHAVVLAHEGSGDWYLYDRAANGSWTATDFRLSDHWSPAGTCNNPHIEIDPGTDRSWISGVMVVIGDYDGCGIAVLTRGTMSTGPSSPVFERRQMVTPPDWASGNLSVDVSDSTAVVWVNKGAWERLAWDGEVSVQENGTALFAANLGERPTGTFRVSRAPAVDHAGQGPRRIWHAAYHGHPDLQGLTAGGYHNSLREAEGLPALDWSDSSSYPGNEEDNFMGLGTDRLVPEAAYMAIDGLDGHLYLNVWDGTSMLFDPADLASVTGSTGYNVRWGPQWAEAAGGGAWLVWTDAGRVKLRFFGLDGVHGETVDIAAGNMPTAATDTAGDVHLLYMAEGQTVYRRVEVSRKEKGVR